MQSYVVPACLALLLAAVSPAARAEPTGPGLLDEAASPTQVGLAPASMPLNLAHDLSHRITVPVTIDGQGPFDFIVDTGADHSVISVELAAKLHLPAGPIVTVRSTSDARDEATAVVDTLGVGPRVAHNLHAPLLPRAAIGADGMLGIDALRDQAMVMDFRDNRLTVRAADPRPIEPGSIVVYGKNWYGQLILLDATVRGRQVYVILDSGAQTTIANSTFRELMADGEAATVGANPASVLSVTGGSTAGQYATLPELTIGRMTLRALPIAFADLYTFHLFHLDGRPAMLLGMDVLRAFDLVRVDYANRKVSFRLNSAG